MFILLISCSTSNQKVSDPNLNRFNPLEFSDYSFYSIDDNLNRLKVFYSIDGSQFMYDKQSLDKYVSNIEVIFQIISKDSGVEVDRQIVEIDFIKKNYYKIKTDNLYQGEIGFDLEDGLYVVNIKIIDLKSRRVWLESIDVNKKSSDLLSNLYFYYLDNENKESHINEFINKDVQNLNCRFQYINSKDVENLNIYLVKLNDTVYSEQISIKPNYNEYDIALKVPDNIKGSVVCSVSDGTTSKSKKLIFDDKNISDFWSYEPEMIKTIMRYVLPNSIYKQIKKMEGPELDLFLKKYWKKMDPDADTVQNELIDELNFRIKYSTTNFKELKTEGWKTDRGRIYIVYGQPKSINNEQNPQTFVKRETWVYPSGDMFIFEDNSFGRYYLINGIF